VFDGQTDGRLDDSRTRETLQCWLA